MKLLTPGAARPDTGAARLSYANDLVRRTLAQHGLDKVAMPSTASGTGVLSGLYGGLGLSGGERDTAPSTPSTPPTSQGLPHGATFDSHAWVSDHGTRRYRLYVPQAASSKPRGVILMLHGCTQTPEDFATGTRMNALADRDGFVVIYPAQARGDNAQSCWNWFSRGDQRRGRGEPALLAGLTAHICGLYGVPQSATFVAGLSAGAAMAVILGDTYPDVFAAVGAHSGLATGSARDVSSAFAAMNGNPLTPDRAQSDAAPVRTIIFHGSADRTVHPSNADGIARAIQAHAPRQTLETMQTGTHGGRTASTRVLSDERGRTILEHWTIDGQGHAWSGGNPAGSYCDAKGPDASAEMVRFFFE